MIIHDYWPPFITAVDPDEDTAVDYPPDPPKCKDCKGKGVIDLFTGKLPCETCDGSGY